MLRLAGSNLGSYHPTPSSLQASSRQARSFRHFRKPFLWPVPSSLKHSDRAVRSEMLRQMAFLTKRTCVTETLHEEFRPRRSSRRASNCRPGGGPGSQTIWRRRAGPGDAVDVRGNSVLNRLILRLCPPLLGSQRQNQSVAPPQADPFVFTALSSARVPAVRWRAYRWIIQGRCRVRRSRARLCRVPMPWSPALSSSDRRNRKGP